MYNKQSENINVLVEDSDPLESNLGKIVFCRKMNGKTFVSRLIAIHGDQLYFKTKDGKTIMDHRSSIEHLQEMA